jgi:hypothetical protein
MKSTRQPNLLTIATIKQVYEYCSHMVQVINGITTWIYSSVVRAARC